MLSLFKKKEPKVQVETIVEEVTSKYPKEVQEIHHAFETAADKLLEEAKSVIDQSSNFNLEKVKRLTALGFKQAKEVGSGQKIIKKVELSKEQIESINYYNKNYPNNKFITEEQVMEICHKYNLVCGDIDIFKGFVPEKNLQDIENFKLKKEDIIPFTGYSSDYGKTWTELTKSEYQRWFSWSLEPDSHNYTWGRPGFMLREKNSLKICAPVKDMDISELKLKNGYKLYKHIPDPIILMSVSKGYLVVTAWGDEANDPILKN